MRTDLLQEDQPKMKNILNLQMTNSLHLKESVEGQSVDHDVHCEEQPVVDHLVVRRRRQALCSIELG